MTSRMEPVLPQESCSGKEILRAKSGVALFMKQGRTWLVCVGEQVRETERERETAVALGADRCWRSEQRECLTEVSSGSKCIPDGNVIRYHNSQQCYSVVDLEEKS